MPVRALLFDIGGVLALAPDGTEPANEFDAMFARWEQAQGTGGALTEFLEQARVATQLGQSTYAEWTAGVALAGRMDDAQLGRFLEEFWDLYLGVWNAPLGEWIASMRSRFRVGLLSNSFLGAREREEARYGLSARVDFIVYSHEVGLAKPNRRIYELACERFGLSPDEVAFVDDVPANVDAARALGMSAVHFRDTASALRELGERFGE